MAELDQVKMLKRAREELRKQRRSLAEALAGGYKRGQTETHVELFTKIQAGIEAIGRAIDDERVAAEQAAAEESIRRAANPPKRDLYGPEVEDGDL